MRLHPCQLLGISGPWLLSVENEHSEWHWDLGSIFWGDTSAEGVHGQERYWRVWAKSRQMARAFWLAWTSCAEELFSVVYDFVRENNNRNLHVGKFVHNYKYHWWNIYDVIFQWCYFSTEWKHQLKTANLQKECILEAMFKGLISPAQHRYFYIFLFVCKLLKHFC